MNLSIIQYARSEFIRFKDFEFAPGGNHGYRWVDIKIFRLCDAAADDFTLLEALIAADEFRDDYIGGGVDPGSDVHGPYRLNAITRASFIPVDEQALSATFRKWLCRCGSLPDSLRTVLNDRVMRPVRSATSLFTLADLGGDARSMYTDVHMEFHEFVLLNRTERYTALVVATDD